MSVCDEGWETVTGECPALQWTGYDRAFDECGFGVYTYLEEERYGWPVINKMPDSCPHAAALRAVVENPELVLVATTPRIAGLMKVTRWPNDAEFREMNKVTEILNELTDEMRPDES